MCGHRAPLPEGRQGSAAHRAGAHAAHVLRAALVQPRRRGDRKLKRLFRAAALPEAARAQRGMDRAQIASLISCDWIRQQQNLIFQGATRVGKTWLACASAGQACRVDIPVLFFRASELCSTIRDRAHEARCRTSS
ncbi:ATP-binding protein [Marilutibacter alkalisoli]|uniref:ATP-binding protein n=1 Tax=Marilutibacter alkalisoli TaxID=2591633 RepID=UPI001ABE9CF2